MFFLYLLLFLLMILMSVAFLTLFELHLMGLSQIRVGPDKNSMMGILQFMFDGVKLLKKEFYFVYYSFKFFYFLLPGMFFFYFLFYWLIFNYTNNNLIIGGFLFFMSLIGFSVYFFILLGMFSKSKYSILGAIRASSQTISFEICFFFLMMLIFLMINNLNFVFMSNSLMMLFMPFVYLMILLEINRTPFDFFESESELVSGYNTEYQGFFFVFLILSEYGMILFFSIFFFWMMNNVLLIYFMLFLFLFVRTVYPRFRYDLLMNFQWFINLPMTLLYLVGLINNFLI